MAALRTASGIDGNEHGVVVALHASLDKVQVVVGGSVAAAAMPQPQAARITFRAILRRAYDRLELQGTGRLHFRDELQVMRR